jgi:hypothetical protein
MTANASDRSGAGQTKGRHYNVIRLVRTANMPSRDHRQTTYVQIGPEKVLKKSNLGRN